MGKNQTINDMMENCRIKIWNASSDEIIRTRFAPFGYTPEKWEEAKTLYNSAKSLLSENEKEHGEWKTASDAFNSAQEQARKNFTKIRQYLKFFYPAGAPGANQLDLYKADFSKYTDFVQGAGSFYFKLLQFSEAIGKLAPFGYTNESVQQLSDEVSQLNILKENREKESGDAQYAVKERNAKIDELYEFCNELTRLAKLIFQDDESQYLEKLGILARS